MNNSLSVELADKEGLAWAQEQVAQYHYLKSPIDVRCSPVAYLVLLGSERVGCLIFGRPEAARCNGWYGSVEDVQSGRCPLTRWQILNLARAWLSPDIQQGGSFYVPNAATWAIAQALRRIVYDYLILRPVVWMEEPYEIREILSYCDTRIHHGTLYRAANFYLKRTNEHGIETYVRATRRLTHAEHRAIEQASMHSQRSQKLRARRMQMTLEEALI